jgi:CRP-like cAMP-binding protein
MSIKKTLESQNNEINKNNIILDLSLKMASEFGSDEAIFLSLIKFLITNQSSGMESINISEIYLPYGKIALYMAWCSVATISRIVGRLKDQDMIRVSKRNIDIFDHTTRFTLTELAWRKFREAENQDQS